LHGLLLILIDFYWWIRDSGICLAPNMASEKKNQHKPLKMIAKFFNKGKRTSSETKLNVNAAGSGTGNASTTDQELNINTELEALHLSRTDNPYIEILSSQDNLDQSSSNLPSHIMAPLMSETEKSSSVMMSPESISPTRSYAGSKEYSLSEIHSHLVRSPPPITWPLSPRSNGTFSPDSSDMDVDNPMMTAVTTISPPTRGYSPYNRSQSEEHILSPCRDLLKSAEFSPVRGTTPELLAISMTAEGGCISPYRDFDIRSDRRVKAVGRCASFISTSNMSTSGGTGYGGTGNNGGRNFSGGSGNQSSASLRNSRAANYNRSSNVYYTMNFCGVDDQDDSMDSEELLSPNRNQMTYSFGNRSSRRSIGGLSLSPMSMSMTGPPSTTIPVTAGNQGKSGGIFASWRRSYRLRSKSSSASSHSNTNTGRKKDTKSMENLLQNERPVPRYSLDYEDELDEENINN